MRRRPVGLLAGNRAVDVVAAEVQRRLRDLRCSEVVERHLGRAAVGDTAVADPQLGSDHGDAGVARVLGQAGIGRLAAETQVRNRLARADVERDVAGSDSGQARVEPRLDRLRAGVGEGRQNYLRDADQRGDLRPNERMRRRDRPRTHLLRKAMTDPCSSATRAFAVSVVLQRQKTVNRSFGSRHGLVPRLRYRPRGPCRRNPVSRGGRRGRDRRSIRGSAPSPPDGMPRVV